MELQFMESLLRIEAEAKYFFGATDRSYEQTLMDELLKIIEEAELLFGPRDRSYELLPPRISECGCAHPYVYPFKKIRIYLTPHSKTRNIASYTADFESSWLVPSSWGKYAAQGRAIFTAGFRSIWDEWKSR